VFSLNALQWKPFEIPMAKLNGGDLAAPIMFTCYDWDKVGSHDLIGEAQTTMQQLLTPGLVPGYRMPLINSKYVQKKKNYENSGLIHFSMCHVEVKPTFIDYLAGGTEIGLMVAIDFTASKSVVWPDFTYYIF
jgi:hypothetical protein